MKLLLLWFLNLPTETKVWIALLGVFALISIIVGIFG